MAQLDVLVVVPAFNEARFIEGCVLSINAALAPYAISYRVVVVDNGSTDETAQLAMQTGVQVLTLNRSSVSHARNVGAKSDDSKLIAFIDADVVVTERWGEAVNHLLNSMGTSPILTGSQYVVRDDAGWIEKYWFKNLHDKHLNGGNILVSRSAFERINGFDEGLKTGEDYDFCLRAQSNAVEYGVNPNFEAIHLGYPRTLGHFIRREIWHGEGDFRSFNTFAHSPVAILSMGYCVALLVMLAFVSMRMIDEFAMVAAAFLVMNLVLTRVRFRGLGWYAVIVNSFLNAIYFFSRAGSLFRALKNRRKKY